MQQVSCLTIHCRIGLSYSKASVDSDSRWAFSCREVGRHIMKYNNLDLVFQMTIQLVQANLAKPFGVTFGEDHNNRTQKDHRSRSS